MPSVGFMHRPPWAVLHVDISVLRRASPTNARCHPLLHERISSFQAHGWEAKGASDGHASLNTHRGRRAPSLGAISAF
jgi:hypothetical protein